MSIPTHSSFKFLRERRIESLNLEYQEFEHSATGAIHIHLSSQNTENVFLVAFRTVPEDSTGVAHILEHTVLCGSKNFPVRDPFFTMLKRSLNTFMNAFTSSDWTAYPFASKNKKDFDNLLTVYLDSVFFPNLNELDFAQEGHRLEFENPEDKQSGLVHKGVVFNEMKGAMSSINSILWQTLTKNLFSESTYHFNSGGDPEEIPKLTFQQFKKFYLKHYHPSNATFVTFGDIAADDHQEKFNNYALRHFDKDNQHIAVDNESRFSVPKRIQEFFPAGENELENNCHVVMAWLLNPSSDVKANIRNRLISSILLDNSGSPLLNALETTPLAKAPSPLCGLEDSMKEMCFVCGVEGTELKHTEKIEDLILSTLKKITKEGLDKNQLIASLNQLELSQREITGSSYPYGLQLILSCLPGVIHRGDPVSLLDIDNILAELRIEIEDPEFLKKSINELFLHNNHRLTLTLQPDSSIAERKIEAEKEGLIAIRKDISDHEIQRIITMAKDLKARQNLDEDISILPKIEISDIPKDFYFKTKNCQVEGPVPIIAYDAATNGVVYQNAVIPAPNLTDEEIKLLPLYTACVTEVGVGDMNYEEAQLWQSNTVGSFTASMLVKPSLCDPNHLIGNLIFSTKGLKRNQEKINELINKTLDSVKFSELSRLEELMNQIKTSKQSGIIGSGHLMAMSSAAKSCSLLAQLKETWSGIESLSIIKNIMNSPSKHKYSELSNKLSLIHSKFKDQARNILLISEQKDLGNFIKTIQSNNVGSHESNKNGGILNLEKKSSEQNMCYTTNTQVNFCSRAYSTVASGHPDSASLAVLGGILRNGYLHQAIREKGGAYGGGASQDIDSGAFRFFSYRDPRIKETLNDFDNSIDWIKTRTPTKSMIEESVLGVISSLDKPNSPSGEAKQAFFAELNGRNKQTIKEFRDRTLNVKDADITRVANKYLVPENCNTAVITNENGASTLNFEHSVKI